MKRILAACLFSCIGSSSFAALNLPQNTVDGRWFVGGGLGVLFPAVSTNQSIPTGGGWPDDHYVAQNASNQHFLFATGGYEWTRQTTWIPAYAAALRYYYASAVTVKGYVDQYSLPQYRNYNYQYDLQQRALMGTFKVDLFRCKNIMPYLLAGVGLSLNKASAYSETATANVTPRVSPGFGSNTAINFAYMGGVGIDYIAKDNLWFNLEYSHGYFGPAKTSHGANTASLADSNYSDTALKNNFTSNNLLLGASYFFG